MPGIFISYRRSDAPDAVGRIYDRLVSEFGKTRVFKDVDSIPLGQDFRGHLNDIVGGCAAVLAIIGPRWTDIRNEAGDRRLEDPGDFVRIELEAALARSVPVVPVLVGHAPMPGTSQLPSSLAPLAFRQSIEVRPDPDFHNDASRLVTALKAIIDPIAPEDLAASGADAMKRATAHVARPSVRMWLWRTAFTAVALAAIAFAFPTWKYLRLTPPPEIRTEISTPTHAVDAGEIALSPDGRQIVFTATTGGVSRLQLRALAATTAQSLPGTEGAMLPFWSPDSRSIGFFTSNALKRLDLGGGAPLTLVQTANSFGGSWSAEGVILFSQGYGKPFARIAATGGTVTEVTPVEPDALARLNPVFLPDGRHFVYGSGGGKSPGIYLGSLDGTAPVRVTPDIGNIAYLASGWLLIWKAQGVLVAQRLDVGKAVLVGAPVTLAEGRTGGVSTSATGLVAYWSPVAAGGMRQLQWRSRTGALLGSIGEPDETYNSPRVSPDGRRVAVTRAENDKQDIWILEGERASRLTFDAVNGDPLWSPDGTQIVFGSPRPDAPGLYQKAADGAGEARVLLKYNGFIAPMSWSIDGRYLVYIYVAQKTQSDLGVLPMTGDLKPWAFLNSPSNEGEAEFSPDGKWVAYESDEALRPEVFIRPFVTPDAAGATPVHSGKWQVSIAGGTYPKWNPNGKELFFRNPAGEMMAAPITFAGSVPIPGTPVKLFQTRIPNGDVNFGVRQFDVAPDGRFLINTVLDTSIAEPSPIILIQNWNSAK